MLGMISESKLPTVCVLLSCFVTCQRRDYLGAENAGLNALLLQRGADGEEGRKGTGIDFRTNKSLHVVKDLYDVLEWVEKRNKTHKEYLGVCWSAPPGIECVPTGRSLIENYQAYTVRCRHLAVRPINQGTLDSSRVGMIVFGDFHATSSMRSPIFNTVARITRGSLRRSLLRLFCFSGDTSKCIVQ
jgi:hypothetical protein